MIEDDVIYYERRAEAELALAQRATDAEAVQAHYEMATAYLELIHGKAPGAEMVVAGC
jgi:hypothetical protein